MALPATDSFTGSNETALATYSASWTVNTGAFRIHTNALYPVNDSASSLAHWNADAFNDNQYAELTIAAAVTYVYMGPAVRVAASANTGYYIIADSGDAMYFTKRVAGTETELGNSAAIAVSDVLRLTANGTTITPNKNGSTTGTPGAKTDASIASGYAGVAAFGLSNGSRIDSWTGDDVGGAPAPTALPRRALDGPFYGALRGSVR